MGGSTVNRFAYTLDRSGLRTGLRETLGSQTKVISYTYDGLLRLTGALENPGSVSTSTDDLAGNRTFAQRDNQVLDVAQYLPTDQRNDWAYDLAGNVIHDDTEGYTQYTYDALNRMTTQVTMGVTTTHTYNGDGVLVAQTANGTTTHYVQDLAAELEQILSDGTMTYVYGGGGERLFGRSGTTRTWYATDALDSLRQTLSDSGTILTSITYDPWGNPHSTLLGHFGFTGELQQGHLVYLRARWYHTVTGTFTSVDPHPGQFKQPYSLHPYQYAYSNPVLLTDPNGECIGWIWGSQTCKFTGLNPKNWNYRDGQAFAKGLATAAVSSVRETVAGVVALATSAQACKEVVQNIQKTAHDVARNPCKLPGMVRDAVTKPFETLYQGIVTDDSYLLGKGMFEAGSAIVEMAGVAQGFRHVVRDATR